MTPRFPRKDAYGGLSAADEIKALNAAAARDAADGRRDPCWSCQCPCHQAGQNRRCEDCAKKTAAMRQQSRVVDIHLTVNLMGKWAVSVTSQSDPAGTDRRTFSEPGGYTLHGALTIARMMARAVRPLPTGERREAIEALVGSMSPADREFLRGCIMPPCANEDLQ